MATLITHGHVVIKRKFFLFLDAALAHPNPACVGWTDVPGVVFGGNVNSP